MIPFSFCGWLQGARRKTTLSRRASLRAERSARAHFVPRLETLEVRTVPSYVFSTFDDPNAGTTVPGQGTGAFGINAGRQIVGKYFDNQFESHGFFLSNGQYTTIDDPNANPSAVQGAFGINARGQIVGMYNDTNLILHGYLFSDGQFTTLDDPNAGTAVTGQPQGTAASGIDEGGQIVGYYYDAHSVGHGFLLSGGQYTTLDDPKAGTAFSQGTQALGINASGQIVGFYFDPSGFQHGFLLSGGQYTTLDDPNAVNFTVAEGINERGQIVGYYMDAVTVHGFLLSGGQYTTLDDPNAGVFGGTQASAINSSGQIVGFFVDPSGFQHGFRVTPDGGGHAANSGGHGGDRFGDASTDETTAASTIQRTINGAKPPSASGSAVQGTSGSIEILFAARRTVGKPTTMPGNDQFTSNDEMLP